MTTTASGLPFRSGAGRTGFLLVLTAAGLVGNYFRYPLYSNVEVLFGSIFALLALQFLGPARGIAAAAVVSGSTCFLWNHPYGVVVLTAEVAFVALLTGRRSIGMVLADTLYWLVLGAPLAFLYFHLLQQVPLGATSVIMAQQALNGICNALVARLIFTGYALKTRTTRIPFHDIACNLLVFFVLIPALVMLAVSSRTVYDKFATALAVLSLVLIVTLALAELISRKVASGLEQFARQTSELPALLAQFPNRMSWPESGVEEANVLINNFRIVADALASLIDQMRQLNETLEDRVTARTNKLAENEAFTLSVVDSLPSSIAVLDSSGEIVLVNEPWRDFARENGDRGAQVGVNYLEVCRKSAEAGDGLASSAMIGIDAVLRGEKDLFALEYPCHSPGVKRWFVMTVTSLNSSRPGAVVSHTEITRRKLAEEALQESEEKHRLLFDSAGDAIFIHDLEARILAVNPLACERLGYTRAELTQMTISQLDTPEQARQMPDRIARMIRQGSLVFETVHLRRDGTPVPTEVSARSVSWNGQCAVMGICRDLTDRKRAEEELNEAKQLMEQVISCAQEGVIVYDLDLNYRVWNPFMEKISGLTAGEVIGRQPAELFPHLVEAGLMEHLKRVLSEEARREIEFLTISASGERTWVSDLGAPLFNTKGEVIGVIATVREITLHKRMDEEMQQALAAAESANATMTRLLRTVAHEFRTPLGLLTACTDILDRYWKHLTPAKRFQQNKYIRNAARQLTELTNSITSFHLPGADGAHSNRTGLLEVAETSRGIAADAFAAWGSGQNFDVAIAEDCGVAQLDEVHFRRVLQNLLTNAFRYTPSDGTVALALHREQDRILLEVTDSGIGIPEEDQRLIFEAFYRSHNVEDRRGLGLGLSIVQESLAKMGGCIKVASQINKGTTMAVEIPVESPPV